MLGKLFPNPIVCNGVVMQENQIICMQLVVDGWWSRCSIQLCLQLGQKKQQGHDSDNGALPSKKACCCRREICSEDAYSRAKRFPLSHFDSRFPARPDLEPVMTLGMQMTLHACLCWGSRVTRASTKTTMRKLLDVLQTLGLKGGAQHLPEHNTFLQVLPDALSEDQIWHPPPTPDFLCQNFCLESGVRSKILTKENLVRAKTAPTAISRAFTPLARKQDSSARIHFSHQEGDGK